MNPARRIILSSVCSSIPHAFFVNQIKSLDFITVSSISFPRTGIQNTEYAHVLSFRIQIHAQCDDNMNLPESLVIKYDNTNYRVFLNFEDVCFKCKTIGHFGNDCPNS